MGCWEQSLDQLLGAPDLCLLAPQWDIQQAGAV
jgi:hypothetical protein